jgi:hypothetical protein
VCATAPERLARALRELMADRELAHERGRAARRHALAHFGLDRFLDRWDQVLAGVTGDRTRRTGGATAASVRR